MVDAGRVIFQVGIDRASADRAISQLEQRFAGLGDIDLKIPDAGPAARAARTVQDAFSNIQIPEFNFSANTQQLSRSVQSAKDELLTLEQAIEGLQRQRIDVELKVARGDADLARLDSQLQGLRDKRIQVDVNARAAAAEVQAVDERLKALTRDAVRLELDVESEEAQRELIDVNARIEKLESRRVKVQATIDNVDSEAAKFEAKINELEARSIKVEANTGDARAQLNQLDRTLEGLSGDDAAATLDRLQRELGSTADAAKKAENETKTFSSTLSGLAAGAAFALVNRLVDAFGALTGKVTEFVAASISANRELRNTENALTILLGSNEAAAESIEFLRQTSESTGQSFSALQDNYAGITAAAKEFGLPQEAVNELFSETSRVLGIFGKSSAESGLAFNALTQIFSKGQVSLEELRGQLGEQLPVALSATANGLQELGILSNGTTSELLDLVSEGLDAATFAEGFTRGLQQIEGTAPGAQQAIASLQNSVLEFQQQLGASLEPLETAFSETFASIFSNIDASALDPLTEAGNRLRESLAGNPELAERLGEALTSFIGSSAEAVASVLDRVTAALSDPSNVEEFAGGIETAGEALGNLVEIGIAVADALILLGSTYSLIVDTEAVASGLGVLADALQAIVSVASNVVDGLGSIADGVERVSGSVPGLRNAVENVGRFGPVIGTAKTAFDSFFGGQEAVAAPEIDISNAVPQQDELDKFVRAARSSNEQIAADSTRSAKAAARERAKANEEAAKEFEEAQKEALANIDIAQQNRIAAVRQNQAAGNISEEQADAQVSEIESDAIRERIQLREDEIAKIEDFASRQVISEKDATDQIRAAREEIADLTLESIESEIDAQDAAREAAEKKAEAAKKAALEQLDAQQRLNDLQAQQVSIQSGIASTALQDQANLIGAQVSLEQSRLSLSRQTLEGKLAEAEAAEDVVAVEEIRDRLLLNQRRSIQAEFNARRQQLQIQQQLTQLDADRQLRLGEIAEAEARIAVERARAAGASADEIQALQQIVSLREQETQALQNQAQVKKDILSIQFEQLDADQELANQRATQERREQAIASSKEQQKNLADEQLQIEKDIASETERRERATSSIVSALAGLSDISSDDALGSLDQLEENARTARRTGALDTDQFRQLQGAIDQAQRFGRSGDGFSVEEAFRFAENNANNPFAAGILDQVGLGGVSSLLDSQQEIAIADSQIERLTNGLTEIKEAIENSPAGIESLTVSTPDPVADAAQITADLTRQQQIAEGVI